MRTPRGFAIGSIMALVMVCLTLAFTVVAIATYQLQTTSHTEASEKALYLAEGAVAIAMSKLHDGVVSGVPYGRSGEIITFPNPPTMPGVYGQISFQNGNSWGWSTNNFDGTQGAGWNGMNVPTNNAYLVAEGVVGGTTRYLDVFVSMPQYNYVLSVNGALTSAGPLVAKAESSMQQLFADNGVPQNNLGANVGSNTSVFAGPNSMVAGDLVCPNPPSLTAPSVVNGLVRQGSVTLPTTIKVTSYDNSAAVANGAPTLGQNPPAPVTINQNTYSPSGSNVVGNIALNNSTLYVNGPLTVSGGITGTGAVIVNGDVSVGGVQLNAANLVALIASGNVTLTGTGSNQSYFQGLVYTEGQFTAGSITVAGAFCAAPGLDPLHPGVSGLSLGNDVQAIYVQAAATIGPPPPATPVAIENLTMWEKDGSLPGGTNGGGFYVNGFIYGGGPVAGPITNAIQPIINADANVFGAPSNFIGNMAGFSTPNQSAFTCCRTVYFDPNQGKFVQQTNPIPENFFATMVNGQAIYLTPAQWDGVASANGYPDSTTIVNACIQAQTAYMNAANQELQGSNFNANSAQASYPNLTLNNFLSDQSPVQIVSWRER